MIKVGGNNTQFHAVDQLTVMLTPEIVKDQLKKLELLGSDAILRVTPLKLNVDQTAKLHVNAMAHVLMIFQVKVTGTHNVAKDQVFSVIFQRSSSRWIRKL